MPARDRLRHAEGLLRQLTLAENEAHERAEDHPDWQKPAGTALDFSSDPEFKLKLESLEVRTVGIELRNSRIVNEVMHGTVFVPDGKMGTFVRRFEEYAAKDTKSGKPKNRDLAESIAGIRFAALESFWTEFNEPFPTDRHGPYWWEVWLTEATNPHDVVTVFRETAAAAGVEVGPREIRFPERRVLIAKASIEQLTKVENLFDTLAELRFAKTRAGEYLALPPRSQGEFIEETVERIQAPPEGAPSVCLLDTGIDRGHPLLEFACSEDHVTAVEPYWDSADHHGHGTEMAGVALYDDLLNVLESDSPIVLRHRLESVKVLHEETANDPDLYGELTSQAISRIVVAAPGRTQRVHCLTITADARDEGLPSSWSARLDAICAGDKQNSDPSRLLIVSAGNVDPKGERAAYPDINHVSGIEDPAQSWNALSVGAYTEKDLIQAEDYENWNPVAPRGQLNPASRTSLIWDNSWPLKPDIVMEGGNYAVDPGAGGVDHIDDLMLLTTRVSPDGALLTTTGDTSAAAAAASRCAAIIWSRYPQLRPETIRGLLVHSARWTKPMLKEFPRARRSERLRCYGYGVPDLHRALWSAGNATTLVIEQTLRPFDQSIKEDKDGRRTKRIVTKEMHLHRLPWPTRILEELLDTKVRMRITLSYFIEPSPGRRGWTNNHRYQSHGLRFEVKRPLETDTQFRERVNKEARQEEEPFSGGSDERKWKVGQQLRTKGSIHSDTWVGTAAQLAECGLIAVYPVSGWWRYRKHLNRWDSKAPYSLIVSIETKETDIDLYAEIEAKIQQSVEAEIEV